MESKIFSIGDIVTLKSHPYISENIAVIISGDHLTLPPLMVVTEISKSSFKMDEKKYDTFRYDCMWFSSKSFKFEVANVYEDQLKLVQKAKPIIDIKNLGRGAKINFKTVSLELGKKKSTMSYDDNSVGSGAPNTSINALLTFLPPVLQLVSVEPYKSKHPVKDRALTSRLIPEIAVKVNYFDPVNNNIPEHLLPLEVLETIEEISEKRLSGIQKIVGKQGYLVIGTPGKQTIIRPKNVAHRSGYYFLRGFDYLTNKMEEFELKASTKMKPVSTPFLAEAPKFDILAEPESATSKFIAQEIKNLIEKAIAEQYCIRIKYINRNEQLTQRTIKNMQMVIVKEDAVDVTYMIGFCLLRLDKRTFRLDRIQNIQLLNIKYRL